MTTKLIDTAAFSEHLRNAGIKEREHQLLMTNFRGSEQEHDFSEPANCKGFGRIRHFRRQTSNGWPENPLPIDPACKALSISRPNVLRAQAFQNAVCNWRCWYCFVPFDLLAANKKHANWLTAKQIVDLYLAEPDRPAVIDLTGGQPDLTPEWIPWMMAELEARELQTQVYLWSDDNLSNDYFWRYLTDHDRERMARYANYGRVGCFKGYDAQSFAFNTGAAPELFDTQFHVMRRLLDVGLDTYAYVTFTTPAVTEIDGSMREFVDRLQAVDPNLPLRTIPLEIQAFTPVLSRMDERQTNALQHQQHAIAAWQNELEKRFSTQDRASNIADIPLARSRR